MGLLEDIQKKFPQGILNIKSPLDLLGGKGGEILGLVSPIGMVSTITKTAGTKTAAQLLGTKSSFLSRVLPQTTKTVAVTKTIVKAPTFTKVAIPLAGGVAGGLLLSKLFGGGTPQTMTPTQTTSAAPQIAAPQDQKATIRGGITNTRTNSPNITLTRTTTPTYSTINQYGAGTIDSVTSPTVTPSVIGGDSIAQLLAALQGQGQAQGQTLTPTQEATQTATSSDWMTPLIIGGALLVGIYFLTNKRR